MLKTSGFPDYDSQIKEQLKTWRFRPYERDGVPVPACAAFTFVYPSSTPASSARKYVPRVSWDAMQGEEVGAAGARPSASPLRLIVPGAIIPCD